VLVIIGTGHAGYTLAREWRKLDPDSPLTLVTRDDGASYYKPDLSRAFAAGKDADGLVKAAAAQMAEQLNAGIRTQTEVTRIIPAEHRIELGAETLTYTKLVLAVGAQPIHPPFAGNATERILSVNNRQDYARFRAALKPGARVLIVGAGLIGCEFANDLAAAGHAVHVVDIAGWPLPRLLPEACGHAVLQGLSGLGVAWHLRSGMKSLAQDGAAVRATLNDGSTVTADVVLSAVGLRPDLSLAQNAGLACGQGIVVDECLKTSTDDVYALGDCIQISGRPLPFILPIAHGARALAPTLAGTPTPVKFPAMPVTVKTPACPVIVCPAAASDGRWEITGAAPDLEAVFVDADGTPAGFALTGAAVARRGALTARMPPVTP
jgi:rubredoxin---NAD+ reductase